MLKKRTERLPCPIGRSEVEAYANRAARTVTDLAQAEKDKKETGKRWKEKIDELKKDLAEFSDCVNTHVEFRDIECYERPDRLTNTIVMVRSDTGEELHRRAMTPHESQLTFDELSAYDVAEEEERLR